MTSISSRSGRKKYLVIICVLALLILSPGTQIFEVPRMRFTEIPRRLQPLLAPPDPIVIHHLIKLEFIVYYVWGFMDSFLSLSLVFAVAVLMLLKGRGLHATI